MTGFLIPFVEQLSWRRCRFGKVRIQPVLINVREERRQLIEVSLGDRVILVVMAASTIERQPQERGTVCHNAISNVGNPEFRFDAAPFICLTVQSIEGRCQLLIPSGVGKHVPSSLPSDELIVG